MVRNVLIGRDEYSFAEPDEGIAFDTEIRPQYIPEGFTLRMIYYSDADMSITYDAIDGREICFDYGLVTEGSAIFIDNENTIHSLFAQDGIEYHYYKATHEYGYNILLWVENSYHYMLSSQLELEELVKIAENVK